MTIHLESYPMDKWKSTHVLESEAIITMERKEDHTEIVMKDGILRPGNTFMIQVTETPDEIRQKIAEAQK